MRNKRIILPETEKQLLHQIHRGDQDALSELYTRYYRILYSYSYKICNDKELSRDCVQDLFLDLWNDKEKLMEVKKIRPYLLQSIWNNTIKAMNKSQRQVSWDPDRHYRLEVVFSVEQFSVQYQLNKERREALRTALEALPYRQKQIIFMLYYEGLSYEEIGKITDLKVQSIRNSIHRAILKLRDILLLSAYAIVSLLTLSDFLNN